MLAGTSSLRRTLDPKSNPTRNAALTLDTRINPQEFERTGPPFTQDSDLHANQTSVVCDGFGASDPVARRKVSPTSPTPLTSPCSQTTPHGSVFTFHLGDDPNAPSKAKTSMESGPHKMIRTVQKQEKRPKETDPFQTLGPESPASGSLDQRMAFSKYHGTSHTTGSTGQYQIFLHNMQHCIRKFDLLEFVGQNRFRSLKNLEQKMNVSASRRRYLISNPENISMLKSTHPVMPIRTSHMVIYEVELAKALVSSMGCSAELFMSSLKYPPIELNPDSLAEYQIPQSNPLSPSGPAIPIIESLIPKKQRHRPGSDQAKPYDRSLCVPPQTHRGASLMPLNSLHTRSLEKQCESLQELASEKAITQSQAEHLSNCIQALQATISFWGRETLAHRMQPSLPQYSVHPKLQYHDYVPHITSRVHHQPPLPDARPNATITNDVTLDDRTPTFANMSQETRTVDTSFMSRSEHTSSSMTTEPQSLFVIGHGSENLEDCYFAQDNDTRCTVSDPADTEPDRTSQHGSNSGSQQTEGSMSRYLDSALHNRPTESSTHEKVHLRSILPNDHVYVPTTEFYVNLVGSDFTPQHRCVIREEAEGNYTHYYADTQYISPDVLLCYLPGSEQPRHITIYVTLEDRYSDGLEFYYVERGEPQSMTPLGEFIHYANGNGMNPTNTGDGLVDAGERSVWEVSGEPLLLLRGAQSGDDGLCTSLLRGGVSPTLTDFNGSTCLHWAAWGDHAIVIEGILREGTTHPIRRIACLCQARDVSGNTPLVVSVARGSYNALRVFMQLAKNGTDCGVCVANNNGRTCLHWAAIRGDVRVALKLLDVLKEGDFVNATDSKGKNALHYACMRATSGHSALVSALLRHGADVNTADVGGRRPIHWAAEAGASSALFQLLVHGLHVLDVRDANNRTPLEVAALAGHSAFAAAVFLARVGCSPTTITYLVSPLRFPKEKRTAFLSSLLSYQRVEVDKESHLSHYVECSHIDTEQAADSVSQTCLSISSLSLKSEPIDKIHSMQHQMTSEPAASDSPRSTGVRKDMDNASLFASEIRPCIQQLRRDYTRISGGRDTRVTARQLTQRTTRDPRIQHALRELLTRANLHRGPLDFADFVLVLSLWVDHGHLYDDLLLSSDPSPALPASSLHKHLAALLRPFKAMQESVCLTDKPRSKAECPAYVPSYILSEADVAAVLSKEWGVELSAHPDMRAALLRHYDDGRGGWGVGEWVRCVIGLADPQS